LERKRIALVIDDDRVAQRTIAAMFWRLGWADPKLVKRGREALELLQAQSTSFDIIILDQGLPVMKGLEVLEALNSLKLNIPPVIMVTGAHYDPTVEPRAIQLGAAKFLMKNELSEDKLKEILEQILGAPSQ
jgi:CheY-like chemotaxis protein